MAAVTEKEVLSVLDEALALEEDSRAAFLRTRCSASDELRRRVEELLDVSPGTGSLPRFLVGEKIGAAEDTTTNSLRTHASHGDQANSIGPYRLLDVLGEGGMGVVYLAEQLKPKRKVAVKVIHPHLLSSESLQYRFEREVHLLGRLDHPGIARIYDAGTASVGALRVPFIAMELVDGELLHKYVERTSPCLNDKLRLIAKLADAVHSAHQKAVVHRDLKPANILITKRGAPKVLDFGIASSTEVDVEQVHRTQEGALLGTFAYMSPEQARGDIDAIDARSDIYSLGLVAFEILTGQPAFDVRGAPIDVVIRGLERGEPRLLGAVDLSLRGDVEAIVSMACRENPNARYESAAALAADIRRFLEHQPLTARAPSRVYVLRRFMRRNRALVGGAVLLTAALLAALVGSWWGYSSSELAREQAESDAEWNLRMAASLTNIFLDQEEANAFLESWSDRSRRELGMRSGESRARSARQLGLCATLGWTRALLAHQLLPDDEASEKALRTWGPRVASAYGELESSLDVGDSMRPLVINSLIQWVGLRDLEPGSTDDLQESMLTHHLAPELFMSLYRSLVATKGARDQVTLGIGCQLLRVLLSNDDSEGAGAIADELIVELNVLDKWEGPSQIHLRQVLSPVLEDHSLEARRRVGLAVPFCRLLGASRLVSWPDFHRLEDDLIDALELEEVDSDLLELSAARLRGLLIRANRSEQWAAALQLARAVEANTGSIALESISLANQLAVAELLRKTGQWSDAERALNTLDRVIERELPQSHSLNARSLLARMKLHRATGDLASARALADTSVERFQGQPDLLLLLLLDQLEFEVELDGQSNATRLQVLQRTIRPLYVEAGSGPHNLGFEDGFTDDFPPGWTPRSFPEYVSTSEVDPYEGTKCLKVELPKLAPGEMTDQSQSVLQTVDAKPYAGKRVRFSAALRVETTSKEQDRASLWFRCDRLNKPSGGESMGLFDNTRRRTIYDGEWHTYTVEGTLESDAHSITFGVLAYGSATAYVDNVRFEILD